MQGVQENIKIEYVKKAIKTLKRVKTAGHKGITAEMLLNLGDRVWEY